MITTTSSKRRASDSSATIGYLEGSLSSSIDLLCISGRLIRQTDDEMGILRPERDDKGKRVKLSRLVSSFGLVPKLTIT